MNENELAELKRKRIAELQQAQEMESQKKSLLKNLLEPAAYERVMNVRLASPELYDQLVGMVAYLYKAGQIRGKLGEGQVLQILSKLRGSGREPTITVKRKD
ncbi:MAG: DNA-binding protein [Candidatus ainarchaeum sp.]|nr:DNA-binding protein [Candidatus ainarchaeum sp.]